MADKLTPLILAALTRAAAEPGGVAVAATRTAPGLFPNSALGKAAGKRCQDDGLLRRIHDRFAISDKGLALLLESQDPKTALEDLVRLLEEKRSQVEDLARQTQSATTQLEKMHSLLAGILPGVMSARVALPPGNDLCVQILAVLAASENPSGQDCPLPELHRRLSSNPSLGALHDALRSLHGSGRLYLHPWTGPLYAIPEPRYALLVGHEVAYYASPAAEARHQASNESLPPANTCARIMP